MRINIPIERPIREKRRMAHFKEHDYGNRFAYSYSIDRKAIEHNAEYFARLIDNLDPGLLDLRDIQTDKYFKGVSLSQISEFHRNVNYISQSLQEAGVGEAELRGFLLSGGQNSGARGEGLSKLFSRMRQFAKIIKVNGVHSKLPDLLNQHVFTTESLESCVEWRQKSHVAISSEHLMLWAKNDRSRQSAEKRKLKHEVDALCSVFDVLWLSKHRGDQHIGNFMLVGYVEGRHEHDYGLDLLT